MKKVLMFLISFFCLCINVFAEDYDLNFNVSFSDNVSINDINYIVVTIRDNNKEVLYSLSKEMNYNQYFEMVLDNSPELSDLSIENANGKYGYTFDKKQDNDIFNFDITIYNLELDKDKYEGFGVTNYNKPVEETNSIEENTNVLPNEEEENIEEDTRSSVFGKYYLKVVLIIFGIFVIVFGTITFVKIKNANN